MMRRLAIGLAVLAAALAGAAAGGADTAELTPPILAQANAPNIPPPPVIRRPRVTPDPLANRPERTRPRDRDTVTGDAAPIEPDVVIVRIPVDADSDLGEWIAQAYGLQLLAETRLTLLNQRSLTYRIPDGRPVPEVLQALSGDARLETIQPSFVYELQAGKSGAPQYTAEKLRLSEAHSVSRGTGVVIALIDTGADTKHEVFRGARFRNLTVLQSGEPHPGDHGTQMAGIMVARGPLSGVAPGAELVSIEAFADAEGDGVPRSHSLAVAQALDRAAQEGAQVVNLSFASAEDPLVSDLLDALAQRGVVLVAAAGNGGRAAQPAFPAAHSAVIAVTATDARDVLFPAANRGSYVDLAAPGVDVLTPAADGRYSMVSGTSVAAAHVSAAAALILQRYARIGLAELETLLSATAVDLGTAGTNPEYGAGLLNLTKALAGLPERLAQPAK